MERGRAIATVVALGIVFGLFWWFGFEAPKRDREYKASIIEIEAEILDVSRYEEGLHSLKLRKVDTNEELTLKLKDMKIAKYGQGQPLVERYKYIPDMLILDPGEIGEKRIYRIKWAGTDEAKELLDIELIQSKEEWIRKQVDSNERPDVSNWGLLKLDTGRISVTKIFARFKKNPRGGDIICFAFYDRSAYNRSRTAKEEPVPMAMELRYKGKNYSTFAINIWTIEDNNWKLYRLEKDDKRYIHISEENGQVKFELK